MITPLIQFDDPRLSQPCRVVPGGKPSQELVANLRDTLAASPHGAGLAAPQLGVLEAVFAIKVKPDVIGIYVNPQVSYMSKHEVTQVEGCLSFPGTGVAVTRPYAIKGTYFDEHGNFHEDGLEGFAARVFLHELDHLHGVCIVDKVPADERVKILAANERRRAKGARHVRV